MTKEELFDSHKYVVKVAIIQHFGNTPTASRIAKQLGAELSDLYQIGYLALWGALDTMDGVNVYGYGLTAVKGSIIEFLTRKGSILKLPIGKQQQLQKELTIDSMDQVYSDSYLGDYTMHDYIPCNVNVENYVIRKMELERKLSRLKEIDRKIFMMKLNGLTDNEVGERLGIKKSTVETRRQRAKSKLVAQ